MAVFDGCGGKKRRTEASSRLVPWRKCQTGAGKLRPVHLSGSASDVRSLPSRSSARPVTRPCAYRWISAMLSRARLKPIQTQAISADAMVALRSAQLLLPRRTTPQTWTGGNWGKPRAAATIKACQLEPEDAQVRYHVVAEGRAGY